MSPAADIRDISTSVSRAKDHAKLAAVMFDTEQEWSAVCGFYSAYHLIRASFLADPVFDDPHRLSKISLKIHPEDRYVSKHSKGGLSSTSYGINEIVSTLYLEIRARYQRLHIASNTVRYGRGLKAIQLPSVQADLAELTRAFEAGEIICALHPSR